MGCNNRSCYVMSHQFAHLSHVVITCPNARAAEWVVVALVGCSVHGVGGVDGPFWCGLWIWVGFLSAPLLLLHKLHSRAATQQQYNKQVVARRCLASSQKERCAEEWCQLRRPPKSSSN